MDYRQYLKRSLKKHSKLKSFKLHFGKTCFGFENCI